ncbi:MAG TPA: heparin lyase I family protein [Solirubrobacterales bacterium]|nr:heparin lyase I family protein [Solirubrobacterales bacterium]
MSKWHQLTPRTHGKLAGLLLSALLGTLALAATASARPTVEIQVPSRTEAPSQVRYAVRTSVPADQVSFYVDGQRRWVAAGSNTGFDRSGLLGDLAPGRHALTVRTRRGGHISTNHRRFLILSTKAKGKGKGKPAPEEPAPAPEEPAPAPAPEEPAPAPAPAPEEPAPAPAPEEPAPAPAPEESAPAPAPAPAPSLLFSNSFDGSFKGWYLQCLTGRSAIVSGSAYQGSANARFEVREGDVEPDTGSNRCEVSGPTFDEGQDIYVRDAIRIPSAATYNGSWQIIQQLHETEWGGSPGIAVFLNAEHALTIGAGDGSPTFWKSVKLQTNRWYELIYRVNLSQSSSTGFVEVWLDGTQQKLLNGSTRSYGQTIQTKHTYLKAGIYRGKASTGVSLIEHDGIAVGTSLSSVLGS